MPTYKLTGKDGKSYRVTADNPEGAKAAFDKMQGPSVPEGGPEMLPPVPGSENEPFPGAAQEALDAINAGVVPGAVPFGLPTEVKRRGSILPIEKTMQVDPSGKIDPSTATRAPALPGFIHDIPEQVENVAQAPLPSQMDPDQMGDVLSLSGFGLAPLKGMSGQALPNIPGKVPSAVQEAINKIERRASTEPHTPKALIVRQEVNQLYNKYGSVLSAVEKEQLQKLATNEGGPVRRMVEKTAGYKPTLGLDPQNLKNIVAPGAGAAMGAGSPESMISGAKAAMVARVGLGVLAKAGVGAARSSSKRAANKEVTKLRKVFERKGEAPIQSTRPVSPIMGNSQPKQTSIPDIPQSTPEMSVSPKTAKQLMEEYMAAEEAKNATPNPNPRSKIDENIAARPPKETGTDPRFLARQKSEKAAAKGNRLRSRGDKGIAQPASPSMKQTAPPAPDRSGTKTKAQQREETEAMIKDVNKDKMREFLKKKRRRGVGSY